MDEQVSAVTPPAAPRRSDRVLTAGAWVIAATLVLLAVYLGYFIYWIYTQVR